MEPINNPAECVICMVTAVEMTEKAQLRKEWRWRFCPLTFREICPGRINNIRIQWLWLCLMTLHRKKNHKKNELSGAEILRKLLRSICSCPIALSLFFFLKENRSMCFTWLGDPRDALLVRDKKLQSQDFLPRFQDARQTRRLRLTS